MEEYLAKIVESIGGLGDRAESSKWALASAIAAAYTELPLYSRGLTSGLCLRLKKSEDMIYNLRNAENLREKLRYDSDSLHVSHFSTLYHLQDRFNLTDKDCIKWLDWCKETDASVRELSQEITTAYTADQRKEFFKKVDKLDKLLQRIWEEAESVSMPDNLRAVTKDALKVVREWIAQLLEWRG